MLYFYPLLITKHQCTGQKSVTDQIELVYSKWDPQSQNSLFHTYLYNTVSVDAAPFYRPNRSDDEEKWEEALQKRPNPGAIPFIVKGFQQLGHRIISQEGHLKVLHGRLYEINNGLTDLLRRHDIDISTRTIECRRRHLQLSQKCLALATKVQVLRNRGYAMDPAEEGLRQKLILLEKTVFDPALNGRGEEIWARMVSVRERVRQLQIEFDKMGRGMTSQRKEVIDDEVMKRTKKVSNRTLLTGRNCTNGVSRSWKTMIHSCCTLQRKWKRSRRNTRSGRSLNQNL